mmetsp:Transcript_14280/g.30586  ORF Transcript_14280/g.30586 Transcript_14280/m.30586 type:complete len:349 (-) Transcript_14280:148-1194(-)
MAGRPQDGMSAEAFHPNVKHLLFRSNLKFDLPYYNPPAQLRVPEERPWIQDMGSYADGHFGKWVKDEFGEWKQDRWSVAREEAEAFMYASAKHGTEAHVQLPAVARMPHDTERERARAHTSRGQKALEAAEDEPWGDVAARRKNFSNTLQRLGVSVKAGRPDIALPPDKIKLNATKLRQSAGAIESRPPPNMRDPSLFDRSVTDFHRGRLHDWPATNPTARDAGTLGSILKEGFPIKGDRAFESTYRLSRDKHTPHPVRCVYGRREQGLTSRVMGKFGKKCRDLILPQTYNAASHTRLCGSTVKTDVAIRKRGPLQGRDASFGESPLYPAHCKSTFSTRSYNRGSAWA